VDVNGDGICDILSGSYSRQDQDMAGLFQVLYGMKGGTFRKPVALDGSDGQPLILPAGDNVDRICTRPFACDLDGDQKLDIVTGNFKGTFGFFQGEGGGKFRPQASWLVAGDRPMGVGHHSDPFLVDWDKDGDLDLLSGSAGGGVFLFVNAGTRTAPKFRASVTLLEPAGHGGDAMRFGDDHCVAPASDTRVWAADVDGDGKLDLLVGDTVTLYTAADGVAEEEARAKDAAWTKRQEELMQSYPQGEADAAATERWQEEFTKHLMARKQFLQEDRTGFVWLLRQR